MTQQVERFDVNFLQIHNNSLFIRSQIPFIKQ